MATAEHICLTTLRITTALDATFDGENFTETSYFVVKHGSRDTVHSSVFLLVPLLPGYLLVEADLNGHGHRVKEWILGVLRQWKRMISRQYAHSNSYKLKIILGCFANAHTEYRSTLCNWPLKLAGV
ncbi:uncharacterized protein ACHE_80325A [Aspergillus chevalieri]|uniref:Uncharacterized protein n=1 Tax=Aspergillus chevalieri TaxID=182096 RepID=A0A7R7VXB1_ASPCH|nr:uncharacterized protein ACHE_80325A [Aspergillus chevalieri]BCR92425.1 hypothetical protein ACHE_80325A [Aspergillus chevalieri]